MPLLHAEEVAEKVRGRPLPDGRGSVSGCKHDAPILSHDRKGVGCRLFQQPLQRAAAAFVPLSADVGINADTACYSAPASRSRSKTSRSNAASNSSRGEYGPG